VDETARLQVVTGGVVVTPTGRRRADVVIEDERVTAVVASGTVAAERTIDAQGLLVLPGLVDAHVHVRDPGFPEKEDFASAGRAALAGGVTTVVVMPHDDPIATTPSEVREKAARGEQVCAVDFALLGAVGARNATSIEPLAEAGVVGVEAWLDASPPAAGPVDAWTLRTILAGARDAGLVTGVYCETASIAAGATMALGDRDDRAAHADSRPAIGEEVAALTACALARELGAPLHLRQLSTGAAVEAGRRARVDGVDVTLETMPHYLTLTELDALASPSRLKVLPPLRTAGDRDALRAALADGTIDIVASDHAPHAWREKAQGIRGAPAGLPGLETMLSVLLERFTPELVARACAQAPAERFGLGGVKGVIAPGHDADLVLIDPAATWSVDPERLQTRAADSPFAGDTLPGPPTLVMRRGVVVARAGEPSTSAGTGRWLRPGGAPR
jgi:dihydroorotase